MSDVIVLEISNVFAEFSRVSRVWCWNDYLRFLYIVLKSFSVSPTYVAEVLSVRVTMAW